MCYANDTIHHTPHTPNGHCRLQYGPRVAWPGEKEGGGGGGGGGTGHNTMHNAYIDISRKQMRISTDKRIFYFNFNFGFGLENGLVRSEVAKSAHLQLKTS